MATSTGVRLTKAGEKLLAKLHAGQTEKLELTAFVLGDSAWTEEEIEASNRIALKKERVRSAILEMSIGTGENAGRLVCSGVINNLTVSESFYVREIGVMANDPDVGEILYLIDPIAANAPTTVIEGNAARQDVPIRMELIAVSRDQVELVLSDSVDLVTTSRLGTAMDEIRAYVDAKSAKIDAVKLQGHPASDFANWDHRHNKTDITDFPVSLPASDVSAWAKAVAKPAYTPAEVGAAAASHTHTKANITDFPTSLPASDVSAWAKAAAKPAYTAAEVGAAAASHTHTKANITDFPTSLPASDVFAWAKAAAKPPYTPAEVGAAAASHTHTAAEAGAAAASHTHTAATQSAAGFMSAADKAKLDSATEFGAGNSIMMRDASLATIATAVCDASGAPYVTPSQYRGNAATATTATQWNGVQMRSGAGLTGIDGYITFTW